MNAQEARRVTDAAKINGVDWFSQYIKIIEEIKKAAISGMSCLMISDTIPHEKVRERLITDGFKYDSITYEGRQIKISW